MKKFLGLVCLVAASFGVAKAQCTPDQTSFNKAYWLAQPPDVRSAFQNFSGDIAANQLKAIQLGVKGFVIDTQIMVWHWDPCLVMKLRQDYGYTWIPNALQPGVQMAPGVSQPGTLTPYDPNNPPAGAIKVSTNVKDYPAFDPPKPVTPPAPITVLVGPQQTGTIYQPVVGDASPDGTKYTDARGTFLKHVIASPFGNYVYWEKIA